MQGVRRSSKCVRPADAAECCVVCQGRHGELWSAPLLHWGAHRRRPCFASGAVWLVQELLNEWLEAQRGGARRVPPVHSPILGHQELQTAKAHTIQIRISVWLPLSGIACFGRRLGGGISNQGRSADATAGNRGGCRQRPAQVEPGENTPQTP